MLTTEGNSGLERQAVLTPHPRSEAYIMGLAAYRGGQFQMEYAEAFEVVLRKY